MTEDEYLKGENPEDDEFEDDFLNEETPDLDFLMLPKLTIDPNEEIERYYRLIKKCRSKEQIINILNGFYLYIATMVTLKNDIDHLQDRAKELEYNVQMLQQMR